ncbi:LPXTG cell wall anchor domain-containing protein [Sulfuracidifex metallicus]|uniref:LPXTG cell wall anchor domain-containing protein n=1 Tax=Sulfuracidifex metallicus DSM 6482 = JCM 9184 TaxID=523847 RepID=A0A6A9QNQ5_SULME|nr:LPXTG cell wall anchor domain-containing protein [Sulfuracidifex metallicus]MUN28915.1 LPXTG cell wall anchor domain-containing protein [Sulfuracidifex metallicus DSM 6482 = JCM 9184]WOE50577.1 LPXTG cell wall anchor domain-containing protein [Sulfuracidifex metallicus DSM 6482 = JCM 9184]
MIALASASTCASAGSISFEEGFGFLLAGIAIVAGVAFFFLTRKNAV